MEKNKGYIVNGMRMVKKHSKPDIVKEIQMAGIKNGMITERKHLK